MATRIKTLEAADSIFNSNNINPKQIESLTQEYVEFYHQYPQNQKSADFLLKAAQNYFYLNQHEQGLSMLDTLRLKYPHNEASKNALMLKGFIYENELQQLDKAKASYEELIRVYPKDPLAKQAQLSIDNLGKTPEEIFEGVITEDTLNEPPHAE